MSLSLLGLGACDGNALDEIPQQTPAVARTPQFQCDSAKRPPSVTMRRLSRDQVSNALSDLLSRYAPTSGAEIMTQLAADLAKLPVDVPDGAIGAHGGFVQFDQAVQQDHADALYSLGTTLGAQLTSTTARRTEIFRACATNNTATDDATCFGNFLKDFGSRALRRPLSDDEVQFFRGAKRSDDTSEVSAAVLADAVSLIVQSPEF
ncbi:MAG: hypothetical protein ACT4TC_20160, partial [Myxococcaceae bacterium]